MSYRSALVIAVLGLGACGETPAPLGEASVSVDELAREYLLLELGMGRHDPAHVDAYFGPADLETDADEADLSLDEILAHSRALAARLTAAGESADGAERTRIDGLVARLRALDTRIDVNRDRTIPFDEESERLFGARAPDYDVTHFEAILRDIDRLIPGDGDLSARVNDFRDRFVIPQDRLADVFDAAIAECRRRTLAHIELPGDESFTLEYVNDKPWSGYNWYQGGASSLIQINTDLPIFISRAVDLGCHEGYPGHHTFNALLEKTLVDGHGWLEFTLYPLFSPQSLIAEGSANYGIELAFPGDERVEFEQRVLFPLAGLDAGEADRYYALLDLLDKLDYAVNEAARDYLNGDMTRDETVQWLVDYSLVAPDRARQRTAFFDAYRSYIVNYNLGQDMVRDYVERDADDRETRWARFERLLSTPMLPSDLARQSPR